MVKSLSSFFCDYGVTNMFHICKDVGQEGDKMYIPSISQSGLMLPDRDYYMDSKKMELHPEYKIYLKDLADMHGVKVNPDDIILLETRIAEVHQSKSDLRDPVARHNKIYRSDIDKFWAPYFDVVDPENRINDMLIDNKNYLQNIKKVIEKTDLKVLKTWLALKLCNQYAPFENTLTDDLQFSFFKKLSGQKEQLPRWKRVIGWIQSFIGEELGKLYVKNYFTDSDKEYCLEMMTDIKESLRNKINGSSWMSDMTKEKALEKLDTFRAKIGYPDQWHSIDGLWENKRVLTDDLVENVANWYHWDWRKQEYQLFYTRVNLEYWEMPPQMVNAYYNPNLNEVVFPAAILQHPFYSSDMSYAQNLGGIGAVIAHELTHGFDDSGRKYDSRGNLSNWWTKEDITEFNKRSDVVKEYFSSKRINVDSINGELTCGENIADIGGLKLSIDILNKRLTENSEYVDLFKSWARIWRRITRKEFQQLLLTVDPHIIE